MNAWKNRVRNRLVAMAGSAFLFLVSSCGPNMSKTIVVFPPLQAVRFQHKEACILAQKIIPDPFLVFQGLAKHFHQQNIRNALIGSGQYDRVRFLETSEVDEGPAYPGAPELNRAPRKKVEGCDTMIITTIVDIQDHIDMRISWPAIYPLPITWPLQVRSGQWRQVLKYN